MFARIDISYARFFFYESAEKVLSYARLNCAVFNYFYMSLGQVRHTIVVSRYQNHKKITRFNYSASVRQALNSTSVAPCSSTGRWKLEQDIFYSAFIQHIKIIYSTLHLNSCSSVLMIFEGREVRSSVAFLLT